MSVFHSIDQEAKLAVLNFSEKIFSFDTRTEEMCYHDTEIARFVKRAGIYHLTPSVFEVCGRMFPWLVPEAHWDTPMWVHWLGDGYDHVIDELVYLCPTAGLHYSTDLLKCREMLCWNTSSTAFCTSARGLDSSLFNPDSDCVLSVFISPSRFVFNTVHLSGRLLHDLNMFACDTGPRYEPDEQFSRQALATALIGSVLFGNEPKADRHGREIVVLKKRALPGDWVY